MGTLHRRKFLKAGAAAGLAALTDPGRCLGLDPGTGRFTAVDALPTPPWPEGDYAVQPVPLEAVRITDAFWRPRLEANRAVSIGYCFDRFEEDSGFSVSKLIEGAAYMLSERPDPELEAYVDRRIEGWEVDSVHGDSISGVSNVH